MDRRTKPDPEIVQLIGDELKRAAIKAQEMGLDGATIALGMFDVAGFLLVNSLGKDAAREVFEACLAWLDQGGWQGELPGIGEPPSGALH